MKILLLENNNKLKTKLNRLLSKKRYEVHCTEASEQAFDEIQSGVYEAAILDCSAPETNCIDLLRQIRRAKLSVPIMMISEKCTVSEKVRALDNGADDFVEIPFADSEFLARLNAVSRRKAEYIFDNQLHFDDLTLNLGTYELSKENRSVGLTNKEMAIMKYLFLSGKNIVGKEDLMTKLWGFDALADNNLEVYISYLRRKIASLQSGTKIVCIKNVGYRLTGCEVDQTA
ncbi:response regulator transcription factor [Caproiciproducens sp. LBM24188]|nr:response regulator transcription factor [Oscillospiraceae bacterium]HHV32743.1 response regulator transcription factor [Clostridiales bacterium]